MYDTTDYWQSGPSGAVRSASERKIRGTGFDTPGPAPVFVEMDHEFFF